jgi:hypothetical protein
VLLATAVTLWLGACASTPPAQIPAKAVVGLGEVRADLVAVKAQLNRTVDAAQVLASANPALLADAFGQFNTQVNQLDGQLKSLRERRMSMEAGSAAYFIKWGDDLAAVQSGPLRQTGFQQREAASARLEALKQQMRTARDGATPLLAELQDIQKYLTGNLTPQAVQSLVPTIRQAVAQRPGVVSSIDALTGQIDAILAGQ